MTIYAFPNVHDPKTGSMAHGMTLKDYFAAFAMQSLIWNRDLDLESKEDVATVAYEYANEMIKAREQLL